MSRKNTKADRILNDSAMRLEAAVLRERLAQSQLNTAKALREYAEEIHKGLEKEYAPTPRKTGKKPAGSATTQQEASPKDLTVPCGKEGCNQLAASLVHDPNGGYAGYHEFEGPKLVARVPRKSKQKSEATNSIPSIEGEMESVTSASNAGD